MCLYPRLIINRKYIPNKKNGYNAPQIKDERTMYVPVGCQKCIECKKQKATQWKIRLMEEIRERKKGETPQFVTLTFSNEKIRELYLEIMRDIRAEIEGYELDNEIATIAVRLFLERWRKKHKKSVKHWLVTELGHEGTENIHLHGLIWSDNVEDIEKIWKYGFVYIGKYVNEKTINYMCKYVMKTDEIHREYKQKVLTSPGIGSGYMKRADAKRNKYGKETDETYKTRTGLNLNLPIYYRNHIYKEDEREKLWIEKLEKNIRYVLGSKIDMNKNPDEYYRALKEAQLKNKRLGFGDDRKEWSIIEYEKNRRKINMKKRLDNTED